MSIRDRFPGADGPWARFDGPAGTQMLDTAIEATRLWAASGNNANSGGAFAAATATDALLDGARVTVGRMLGASADGICFGANMTTMNFAFTRALARQWNPGDRIVATKLDHDANVTPWRLAAEERGAEFLLVDFDARSGRLDPEALAAVVDERTRWVAVTGASNLLGTKTDLPAIVGGAHQAGARVFVDAVHLAPHAPIDIAALGCDALITSSYKWYGPHAAALWVEPELLEGVRAFKVRPAPDHGPRKLETGTPNLEAIAGMQAAAAFIVGEGIDRLAAAETIVFAPLLEGLLQIRGVRVLGPHDLVDRTPTVSLTIDGHHPDAVAAMLAAEHIAAWSGDSYATHAVEHLGLAATGGVVRLGVVGYVDADDVQRALRAIDNIATRN